jgi:predicted unusual protein kinase regulating ubiquinone biosynthesis (AarF/ABC1/UbiB family)
VHSARTFNGREVVVKVLRPGVKLQVDRDMRILILIVRFLSHFSMVLTRYRAEAVVREVWANLRRELDLREEARNAHRFAEAFHGWPTMLVPDVIPELCTETVMVQERIFGERIELVASRGKRADLAQILIDAYLHQFFVLGFFHGDPHPGNLLIRREASGPVLVILDLGLAKEFTPELRDGVIRLTLAIIGKDPHAIGEAFRALGFKLRDGGDNTFVALGELFLGQALNTGRAYADMEMIDRIQDELLAALRANPIVRAPSDLMLVLRVMGLLSGIGKTLDSQVNPLAAILPFLQIAV